MGLRLGLVLCKRAYGVAQGLRKLRVYAQGPGCGVLAVGGHDEKGARTKFYVSRIWGLRFAPGRLKQTQSLKPKSLSAFQWLNMSENSAIHGLVQCLQCPESKAYIIYANPKTLSHTATVWSKRTLALHDFLLILPLVSTAVSLTVGELVYKGNSRIRQTKKVFGVQSVHVW